MKKRFALALALFLLLATGCGPQKEPEPPLQFEVLTVEFAPAAQGGPALLGALQRFPETLRAALAEAGVAVGAVQVTLGTSQDATARAVGQGGVDVALLSPEEYLRAESGGTAQLADPGRTALICAGSSDYGRALAGRRAPTWAELDHARWGVLPTDADLGHRYVNLWLADGYEGRTLSDLTQVREYESYEALLRAAAAGEIDVFPATEPFLQEISDAWTLDPTREDAAGYRGFGREIALADEVTALGETALCYTHLVVVREDETLAGTAFQAALAQALNALLTDADRIALAGPAQFSPIPDQALDPLRRLFTLEG